MKIRTDFVTNSSSSSFCAVKIHGDNVDLDMRFDCLGFYTFWFRDPEVLLGQCASVEDLLKAILFSVSGDELNIPMEYIERQLVAIPDVSTLDSITIDCHEEIADRHRDDPWPRNVSYTYDFKNKKASYSTDTSWRQYRGMGDRLPPIVRDLDGNAIPFLADELKGRLCVFECHTKQRDVEIPEAVLFNGRKRTIQGLADECFSKAKDVERIILPITIEYIAPNAFHGCKSRLKELSFKGCEPGDPYFVCDGQKLNLVLFSGKKLPIPEDATELGEFAFGGAWRLETIVLHNGMKKPTMAALSSCSTLKTVEMPDGTKVSIKEDSAKKCFTALKGVLGFNYKKYAQLMIKEENAREFEKAVKDGKLAQLDLKELYDEVRPKRRPAFKQMKDLLLKLGADKNLSSADEAAYDKRQEKAKSKKPTITQLKKDKRFKDWDFKLLPDRESIEIIKYKGKDEDVIIPDEIGGMPVAELNHLAFSDASAMRTISIPKSLFFHPRYNPFIRCERLAAIQVDPDNEHFTSIKGSLFDKDAKALLIVPRAAEALFIPVSTRKIQRSALELISFLKDIEVADGSKHFSSEDGVLYDGKTKRAMYACKSIRKASLPDTVAEIDNDCFQNCVELVRVDLSVSLVNLGDSAFFGCESLTEIEIPDGVKVVPEGAFELCSSLMRVELPSSLELIESHAFRGCRSLEEIVIPASVKEVAPNAFDWCDNLRVIREG